MIGIPRAASSLAVHAILSLVALGSLVLRIPGAGPVAIVLRAAGALMWVPHGYDLVRPGPAVHPYGAGGGVLSLADIVHSMLRSTDPTRRDLLWRGAGGDEGPGRDYVRSLAFAASISAGAGSPSFGPIGSGGELLSTAFQVFFAAAAVVGVAKLVTAWLLEGRIDRERVDDERASCIAKRGSSIECA